MICLDQPVVFSSFEKVHVKDFISAKVPSLDEEIPSRDLWDLWEGRDLWDIACPALLVRNI